MQTLSQGGQTVATATAARTSGINSSTAADEWIATKEACEILGRSRSTLYKLAKAGLLLMNRPGRSHPKFLRSEVLAMARRNGVQVS